MKMSEIPTRELVDDYLAARKDRLVCGKLSLWCKSAERREAAEVRVGVSTQVMDKIKKELVLRGEQVPE